LCHFIRVSVSKSIYVKLPDSYIPIRVCTIGHGFLYISKYPHPRPPTIVFGVNHNLVGKRVCFAGRYWGNVILLPVYRRDNLHSSFQQHRLHSFSNLSSLCGGASASHLSTQHGHIPLSVLGVASVTSSVHCSQHTSSSPFIKPQAFRRFFSKN